MDRSLPKNAALIEIGEASTSGLQDAAEEVPGKNPGEKNSPWENQTVLGEELI